MNDDDATMAVRVPRNRHEEFARMAASVGKTQKPEWILPPGGKVRVNLSSNVDKRHL